MGSPSVRCSNAMPSPYAVNLEFPLGGLHRRFAYQKQPPYTTPDALNVRPDGRQEGRARGGSRPGLGKAYDNQLGSGNPVRMLADLMTIKTDGLHFWEDNFRGEPWAYPNDPPTGDWTVPDWATNGGVSLRYQGEYATRAPHTEGSIVLNAVTDLDTSQPYSVGLHVVPNYAHHNGAYYIYLRFAGTASTQSPHEDGVVIWLHAWHDESSSVNGLYYIKVEDNVGGVDQEPAGTRTYQSSVDPYQPESGWFTVTVDGDAIKVYWLGEEVCSVTGVTSTAATSVGFGMKKIASYTYVPLAEAFRFDYHSTSSDLTNIRRKVIMAVSNGDLYRDVLQDGTENPRTMELVANQPTDALVADRYLQAVQRQGKLYIADHDDPVAEDVNGSFTGGKVMTSGTLNWANEGVDITRDVIFIFDGTQTIINGTYKIASISGTDLTLDTTGLDSAHDTQTGTCSFKIVRSPKEYLSSTDTLSIWVPDIYDSDDEAAGLGTSGYRKGSIELECPGIVLWRDRVGVWGAPDTPHVIFFSRSKDPYDWDFGQPQSDADRATTLELEYAGTPGEAITAAIPHSYDYLVVACADSLWVQRGDPAFGAMFDNLSRSVGIISRGAWCSGPDGEIVFLTRNDGLYILRPGAGMFPEALSREVLPRELRGLNPDDTEIHLSYDAGDMGVHIYLTPKVGTRTHWWFAWGTKGFWKVSLPEDYQPFCTLQNVQHPGRTSTVLLGDKDGYIRSFGPEGGQVLDELTAFETYALYGPIRLGRNEYMEGMLKELIGVLPENVNAGDIEWSLWPGETHDEAALAHRLDGAKPFARGVWSTGSSDDQGLQITERPRTRGGSMFLKLSGNQTVVNDDGDEVLNDDGQVVTTDSVRPWTIERVTAVIEPVGKQRRL